MQPIDNPRAFQERIVVRLQEIDNQISHLSREREALFTDLETVDRYLDLWRRTHNVQGPEQQRYLPSRADPLLPRKRPKNPPRDEVVSASLSLIEAAGHPLSRQALFDQLRAVGVSVYGKDPQMVLSTMLWRTQDRIVRLPNFGYWPTDRAFSPAGYMPEFEGIMRVAATEPEGELEEPDEDDVSLERD